MEIGITLPTALGPEINGLLVTDWAREADQGGFAVLGATDRPNYDSWEPLATLAGVSAVTAKIKLATTVMLLPTRNATLVAKQAAVIDHLSNGRLILGVGQGSRQDDYLALDANFVERGPSLARAVDQIREVWKDARATSSSVGVLGPPPRQTPSPPIWIGAVRPRAIRRAVEIADGIILTALPPPRLIEVVAELRSEARSRGRTNFTIAGFALVAVGTTRRELLSETRKHLRRYFGPAAADVEQRINFGDAPAIAEVVSSYAASGVDVLMLAPQIPDIHQVATLADALVHARSGSNGVIDG